MISVFAALGEVAEGNLSHVVVVEVQAGHRVSFWKLGVLGKPRWTARLELLVRFHDAVLTPRFGHVVGEDGAAIRVDTWRRSWAHAGP